MNKIYHQRILKKPRIETTIAVHTLSHLTMKPKVAAVEINILKNASKGRKKWTDLLMEEAKQFCLNTALHGYRFIVLPKRILLER